MTWPSQCPGSASAQMFKFNLDPQGDNSGLRGWDCCCWDCFCTGW